MKNMEKRFLYNKRGISQVVVTILLILIGIVAVSIVSVVIIGFTRDSLDNDCLSMLGKVEIDTGAYACYDSSDVKLSIKLKEVEVKGFIVNIYGDGKSQRFEFDASGGTGVAMLDGGSFELPGKGEERTYVLSTTLTTPGSAELGFLTEGGDTCEAGSAELYPC